MVFQSGSHQHLDRQEDRHSMDRLYTLRNQVPRIPFKAPCCKLFWSAISSPLLRNDAILNLGHFPAACALTYNYSMVPRKQSVGLLLILLFAGRTLIPDGYMLASTEENNLSSIKLNLCPSQNNFSFDSDGLDTAESPTHRHHHHHPINSAIGENVEHKNDTTVSSSESCFLVGWKQYLGWGSCAASL